MTASSIVLCLCYQLLCKLETKVHEWSVCLQGYQPPPPPPSITQLNQRTRGSEWSPCILQWSSSFPSLAELWQKNLGCQECMTAFYVPLCNLRSRVKVNSGFMNFRFLSASFEIPNWFHLIQVGYEKQPFVMNVGISAVTFLISTVYGPSFRPAALQRWHTAICTSIAGSKLSSSS